MTIHVKNRVIHIDDTLANAYRDIGFGKPSAPLVLSALPIKNKHKTDQILSALTDDEISTYTEDLIRDMVS